MSSFKIQGKVFEESEFSSISTWNPPDRCPQFYKLCRGCSRPFYTKFNFVNCPSCRDVVERALIIRRGLHRASLSDDL